MRGVDLDVSASRLAVVFEGGEYARVDVALPEAVAHETASAKFNKRARVLTVTMEPMA